MDFNLAEWVSSARKNAKLTQEQLALALGYSGKGSVSAFENGKNEPPFRTILSISKICNYPLPYQTYSINTEITIKDNQGVINSNNGNSTQTNNNVFHYKHETVDFIMPDNSMSPVLPKGTQIWIDRTQNYIENGKMYLVDWGGILYLRILHQYPNKIEMKPRNQEHSINEVQAQEINILGRVVKWLVQD